MSSSGARVRCEDSPLVQGAAWGTPHAPISGRSKAGVGIGVEDSQALPPGVLGTGGHAPGTLLPRDPHSSFLGEGGHPESGAPAVPTPTLALYPQPAELHGGVHGAWPHQGHTKAGHLGVTPFLSVWRVRARRGGQIRPFIARPLEKVLEGPGQGGGRGALGTPHGVGARGRGAGASIKSRGLGPGVAQLK